LKDVIAYTAGALLVAYVGYIFISPDEPTRVSRACIPAAAATRLLGATVRLVSEDAGESLLHGKPYEVLVGCRNAVWFWAKDTKKTPKFPENDALFGSYVPKGRKNSAAGDTDTDAEPNTKQAVGRTPSAAKTTGPGVPLKDDEDL